MERLTNCVRHDVNSAVLYPAQNLRPSECKQFLSTTGDQDICDSRYSDVEMGSVSKSEFSTEGTHTQERFSVASDAPETDLEIEDNRICDYERKGSGSNSPPPKRKRLSQVVLHRLQSPVPVSYALVKKSAVSPSNCHCEEAISECHEDVSDTEQISRVEDQVVVVTRRKCRVLHFIAMVFTFTAIVSLWGILDMLVEVVGGESVDTQFQLYGVILLVGVTMALLLRKLKARSYKGTFYPTLLSSLMTAAAGWGIVDLIVEFAAGDDKVMRLLYYSILFVGTGILVALHMLIVDREFRDVLDRFI